MRALAIVLLISLVVMVGCLESTPPKPFPVLPQLMEIEPEPEPEPSVIPVTPTIPVYTPPELPQVHISNAVVSNIQANSVDITLDTNLPATVFATVNGATYKGNSDSVTHRITIDWLLANTNYTAEISAYSESDSDVISLPFTTNSIYNQYNDYWQGVFIPSFPYYPPQQPQIPTSTKFWQGNIEVEVQ